MADGIGAVAIKAQSTGRPEIPQRLASLCIPWEEVHKVAGRHTEQANKGKRVGLQTVSGGKNR